MKRADFFVAFLNVVIGGAVAIATGSPLCGMANYAFAALICADAICDTIRGRT